MKKYINELIEIGMGSVIDMSADRVILEDETYRTDIKDAEEIHDKFFALKLGKPSEIYNKIMVLDGSTIIAFDTHENLMNSCEVYIDIYNSQLKREGDE